MQKNNPSSSAGNSSGYTCKYPCEYPCEYLCPLEQLSKRLEQIGQFEDNPRLAIACSGGGDSLALLLLCKEWWLKKYGNSHNEENLAKENPAEENLAKESSCLAKTKAEKCYEHNIVALICDHRMRAESISECQNLKETIEKQFKLSAHILTAQSFANQRGNLQQNMRHFRIKACQEWCRKNAVIHLLFGHTQDDQVETCLLQQTNQLRGSGAMQELRYARHVRIIRPMLEIRRLDLRKWLAQRNISWLEDPSNQSSNYARNRLRRELELEGRGGGGSRRDEKNSIRSMLNTCEQIMETNATANSAIDKELEKFTAQYVALYPEGYARIDSRAFLKLPELPAQRLISSLAQLVGGKHVRGRQVKQVLPLWREKMENFLAKGSPTTALNLAEQGEKPESKPPILSLGRTILLANKNKGESKGSDKSIGEQMLAPLLTPLLTPSLAPSLTPCYFFIVRAQTGTHAVTHAASRVVDEEFDITWHKETMLRWRQNPLWDGRYRILPPLQPRAEQPRAKQPIAKPLQQPLSLACRLLGRLGVEQLRAAAKNKMSQEDDYVVQAIELFEALPARIREACPAFWQKDQLRALPTLKIYRNFPPPETRAKNYPRNSPRNYPRNYQGRGYQTRDCWLSTKESAQLPRIRWKSVEQQNVEKNAIFNLNLNP